MPPARRRMIKIIQLLCPDVTGLKSVGEAATRRAKALLLKDLLMGPAVLGGPGGVVGWVMNESFGYVKRRHDGVKQHSASKRRAHRGRIVILRETRARLSTDLFIRAGNASWPGRDTG